MAADAGAGVPCRADFDADGDLLCRADFGVFFAVDFFLLTFFITNILMLPNIFCFCSVTTSVRAQCLPLAALFFAVAFFAPGRAFLLRDPFVALDVVPAFFFGAAFFGLAIRSRKL